jgi:tetratricopeptide (TPR) repeat protein
MNLSTLFSALLLGVPVLSSPALFPSAHHAAPPALVAAAPAVAQVETIAKQVTVRIFSSGSPGSGVIVAKDGNTYWVLTANHVVESIRDNEGGDIVLPDQQNVTFTRQSIQSLGDRDTDLALVKFSSSRQYTVAKLSTFQYRLYEDRDYSRENPSLVRRQDAEQRPFIFVAGWPNIDGEGLVINPGILVDTSASAIANPRVRVRSYELVYTNLTYVGMSGGPVLDSLGRVIGIHGRAEGKSIGENDQILEQFSQEAAAVQRVQMGNSLGIPSSTILRAVSRSATPINFTVENSAPPALSDLALADSWRPTLTLEPTNPFYWLDQGNQLWRIGRIEEAQASFDNAIQRRSDFYLAWFAKGFVHGFSERYEDALSACSRAIENNRQPDDYYDGWRCKAGALQNLNQFPAALVALNQAIEIQAKLAASGDPGAYQNPSDFAAKAELLFAMGQYRGAMEAIDRAMELRQEYQLEDSPRLHNSRGLALMQLEKYSQALAEFDQAVKLDVNYATAWAHRGAALRRLDRLQEALESYGQALQIEPNDPYIWNNQGMVFYSLGQCSAALDAFNQAIAIEPGYEPAIENRNALQECRS